MERVSEGLFQCLYVTAAISALYLQPTCYQADDRKHVEEFGWGGLLGTEGYPESSPLQGDDYQKCMTPHSLLAGLGSNSVEQLTGQQTEEDASFQRLSLVGVLVMLGAGVALLYSWVTLLWFSGAHKRVEMLSVSDSM